MERVGEYEAIFNTRPSVKRQEKEVVFGGLSVFNLKQEGNTPDLDSGTEAYLKQYLHNTYALGIKITKEAMEDELYGVALGMSKELARAALYTREILAMTVFNNLAATQYTAGGTNFPLLSTSHFRVDDGTWSNQLSSGADLSIESLEAALTQWRTGMVDQRGRKIGIEPKVLMVGPTDRWVAMRLVKSTQRPFTADNDVNALTDVGLEVRVMTHMTDDGRWFLLADKEQTSLTWFDRRPVTIERETEGIGTSNLLMTGSFRASYGITHPIGIFGSS